MMNGFNVFVPRRSTSPVTHRCAPTTSYGDTTYKMVCEESGCGTTGTKTCQLVVTALNPGAGKIFVVMYNLGSFLVGYQSHGTSTQYHVLSIKFNTCYSYIGILQTVVENVAILKSRIAVIEQYWFKDLWLLTKRQMLGNRIGTDSKNTEIEGDLLLKYRKLGPKKEVTSIGEYRSVYQACW